MSMHHHYRVIFPLFLLAGLALTACGGGGGGGSNIAPVGIEQSLTIVEDTPITVILSGSDADGDALTYTVVGASHGSVTGIPPNITFTPDSNFNGSGGVIFKVNDGQADSVSAVISIGILAINDAPLAQNAVYNLLPGNTVNGTLNGSDVDSTTLTFSIVTMPSNGTLTLMDANTGAFSYTLDNAASSDSFTFLVNDGTLDSNIATVNVGSTVSGAPASGLVATPGDQRVTLNWDPVPGADNYNVYWSQVPGSGVTGNKIAGVTPPFYHDGVTNGATYYYVVTAANTIGESGPSPELSATPIDIRIDSLSIADPKLVECLAFVAHASAVYVHDLTFLNCPNSQATNLSGIEQLTSLNRLDIRNGSIVDISAVSGLTRLTSLILDNQNISDISALSRLTNLQYLSLTQNNISDINALSQLTSMTYLYLNENSVININSLAGLTALTELYLPNNRISDVSPLAVLVALTRLELAYNNSVPDVSPLANLTQLDYLGLGAALSNYNTTGVDTLVALTKATQIALWNNRFSIQCAELNTLITALGSPPVDTDGNLTTTDSAIENTNCVVY